ncbi:pancreatic lipase-related protein 2 [Sitophilus oryzae]|uniref:Pancreatic lipase-related protein 2 n=1 Tax=Sitophilus oryzae TaxID=7048 RepID=A0A6J2Y5M6_SITOR|nr:pancreatic lipase-related protein 2 [Sitophilus oryzae]
MKLSVGVLVLISVYFKCFEVHSQLQPFYDIKYWRCVIKKTYECPDNDIKYYLYTPETGKKRLRIDIRNHLSLRLSGFDPDRKNAIIIHGFNGTESKTPMTVLRDAFLYRRDYNIFTIDWADLTTFPCYLSSLSNTRVVSQCTAKLYAFIMDHGGDATQTMCVGHSLGAHICGMVSNHLSLKQHKIVGLDPARPLIDRYANKYFRLTKDDAHQVQIIHTNAGFLGEVNQVGHVDFCVNGGMRQPGCKGRRIRIARCSHFQSACYFAKTVKYPDSIMGRPCDAKCPKIDRKWGYLPGKSIPMGHDTPYGIYGSYCVNTDTKKDCPFE